MKTNENSDTFLIQKLFTCLFYVWLGNSSRFSGWTISVCSFYTSKLLFQRNNTGNKYIKRMLSKGYSVPWDFSWIENFKLM